MSEPLKLRIYIRLIGTDENRLLRDAIAEAPAGHVTYVDSPEGQAAIVPVQAAQWWEAYLAGLCAMCGQGSHAHCSRYSGTECNCLNTDVHHEIEMERAARAGLLSRRHR